MRRLPLFMMIMGLAVFGMGCDSNDDDSTDADPLVGAWILGGLSDANGDRTATFAEGFNSVEITFSADNSMTMVVDSKVDAGDLDVSGTYTTNESAGTLNASLTVGGQALPLTFTYDMVNDTTVRLTATGNTSILLGTVFATSLADPVVITVVKAG